MARSDTDQSTQGLDNRSFSDDYSIYENLIYGYEAGGSVKAISVDASGYLNVNATIVVESLEGVGVFNDFEQATGGTTDSDAAITLSQEVESFDIQNTGDDIVYVNFDTAATTAHIAIDPGMTMSRSLKVTAIHGICDAGLTSTLRVVGYY